MTYREAFRIIDNYKQDKVFELNRILIQALDTAQDALRDENGTEGSPHNGCPHGDCKTCSYCKENK